jgi:myo-inositol 2-dehydrogenase/D-chiro-inositol 1-dehydrogenase
MGSVHAETLCTLPAVDAVIVADTDPAQTIRLAARFNTHTVAHPDDLLRAGLDGLVIAAATDAHAALIIAGVRAGIPVFCEKPAAPTVAATRAVLEATAGAPTPVFIGFQRRFDAGFGAAREAVHAGKLGWLHTIRAGTLDPAPPPLAYLLASGGFFRDCSVHDFDAIRWVTGQEVVEVYALGTVHGDDRFHEADDVDSAAALLELSGGAFAHVSASRYNAHGYDVRLELLGSEQSLSVGLDDRLPIRSAEPGVSFPAAQPYSFFMDRFANAYAAEMAAFTEVVANPSLAHPLCSLSDALEATLIAEACDISRRQHRPVRLDALRRG